MAFLSVVCSFEYGCVISFGQVVSEFLCSFSLLQVFRKEEITLDKVLPSETLGRMKRALYVRYLKKKEWRPSIEEVKLLDSSMQDASVPQTPLRCSVITLIQTADFFCSLVDDPYMQGITELSRCCE